MVSAKNRRQTRSTSRARPAGRGPRAASGVSEIENVARGGRVLSADMVGWLVRKPSQGLCRVCRGSREAQRVRILSAQLTWDPLARGRAISRGPFQTSPRKLSSKQSPAGENPADKPPEKGRKMGKIMAKSPKWPWGCGPKCAIPAFFSILCTLVRMSLWVGGRHARTVI